MRPHPILLPLILVVAACQPGEDESAVSTSPPSQQPTTAASAVSATPSPPGTPAGLAAAGPATSIPAEVGDDLQPAASVIRVDPLDGQGPLTVKLFGVGGGDPAMNGLQTSLAVFRSPAEGWAVFRIADVLDYRILAQAPGRVDLELTESRMDGAGGQIGQGTRRVIVGWTSPTDGAAPTAITVTPAR